MLRKKQRRVARALYEGRETESEICARFRISARTLRNWQENRFFKEELERLCRESRRETQWILSRFGPVAAARLVELLDSDKPDIVRRSALDMIDRCISRESGEGQGGEQAKGQGTGKGQEAGGVGSEEDVGELTDDEVRQMVVALAETMKEEAKQ